MDITSDQSVREGLGRVRIGYGNRLASVIHLAAYYDFSGTPSDKYETVTLRGTEWLLRELQAFEVEQFVFSSTMRHHEQAARRMRRQLAGRHLNQSFRASGFPLMPGSDSALATAFARAAPRRFRPMILPSRPIRIIRGIASTPY